MLKFFEFEAPLFGLVSWPLLLLLGLVVSPVVLVVSPVVLIVQSFKALSNQRPNLDRPKGKEAKGLANTLKTRSQEPSTTIESSKQAEQ